MKPEDVSEEMIAAGMVVLDEFVGWRDYPYTAEDLVGAILRAGVNAYVPKPVKRDRTTRADPNDGFVYFFKCGGHIKIGKAINVQSRMAEIQTGAPMRIECLGVMKGGLRKEAELHQLFSRHRSHGEWFDDCQEIREFIKANCKPLKRQRPKTASGLRKLSLYELCTP